MVYIVESTPARAHVVDLNQDVIQRGCGGYLYIAQFQALASLIRQRSDSVRGFRTEATGSNTVEINYFFASRERWPALGEGYCIFSVSCQLIPQ